ncbi:MAG TPA: ABC transporter permease [Deltaproteobacteria bacterium]|nr:ABC transporter permease [Deltaproteobacteria bacterium]
MLRIVVFLATLLGAIAFVGLLLVLAPGDPISLIPNGEELRPQLEAEWGLSRPLHERYLHYLSRILTLDLGTSLAYRPGQPVIDVIRGPALYSLGRVLAALSCAMAWGTALAWWTAERPSAPRILIQGISIVPIFLLAHATVTGLNEGAFALMTAGYIERPPWFALPDQPSALRTQLSILLLAVGSGSLSEVHAQVEEALVRIRRSAYVDAARARGAPLWPHIALNLLPPLASTLAERAAFLAGGIVIVEKVLLLNGAGSVLWEAALLRDYDLAMALALLAAAAVGLVRLASDAVRLAVDPRLRGAT